MVYHLPRRLFHATASSVFPVLALFLEEGLLLTLLLATTLLYVGSDVARLLVKRLGKLFSRLFSSLLRESEEERLTGSSYVLLGTLGSFALFPPDVAVLAVLYAALGDPIAAVVGGRFAGKRIAGKSPWGTAAMIAIGLGIAGLLHITGAIGFRWPAAVGAAVAGITELAPLPLDDNLVVPLAAGGVMVLLA